MLFLSNHPNFWVRKAGADSLVNETFEMFTLCHLQEWHRGARQVNPRRLGILFSLLHLHQDQGCARVRIYSPLIGTWSLPPWGLHGAAPWTTMTQTTRWTVSFLTNAKSKYKAAVTGVERFHCWEQAPVSLLVAETSRAWSSPSFNAASVLWGAEDGYTVPSRPSQSCWGAALSEKTCFQGKTLIQLVLRLWYLTEFSHAI